MPRTNGEVTDMPESHRFIIDRHEGDLAVVEVDGGPVLDLPRWLLPHAARPDDVLAVSVELGTDRAVVTIVRDVVATERARAEARRAVDRLRRRDPGGDVVL
ncbi:MAG: DUF3006 domain-containing protein [Gemmatimonadetes bacterium]|nr:MAG: DUF3006 domain-containing protein [Gemmatimonadota bacterium]